MPIPWEGLGLGLAAFVAMLGKTLYNGRLHDAITDYQAERESAKQADDTMPEVVERLETIDAKQDQTYEAVHEVADKADRNAYLIQQFHGDEEIAVDVGDVLDDDDFYRGTSQDD